MKELHYEFYIGGTPEQVWETLISPEGTKQIYYGSVIQSTFKEGELLEYVGPGADGDETIHVYGTLLEFTPQKAFRFTHKVGPPIIRVQKDMNRVYLGCLKRWVELLSLRLSTMNGILMILHMLAVSTPGGRF